MKGLEDKVVIVTGASSGIGAALAAKFSAEGARVALVARRAGNLMAVVSSCPGKTLSISADVTEPDDRDNIIEIVTSNWGRIDILVNNAGIGSYGDFESTTEVLWRNMLEVNLMAPVLLTKAVLPTMRSQGSGLIVNVASIGALMAHSENVTPYVASKHGLLGFSRALARDLEETSISVLVACPHLTNTDFFTSSECADEMVPVIEQFRDFMDNPEDVAAGIVRQLDSQRLVIFPTEKPARAYEKYRDI